MREIFVEYYSNIRQHSLQSFWTDCLQEKAEILELSYEDYFQTPADKSIDDVPGHPPVRLRSNRNETFEDGLNIRANELEEDLSSLNFMNLKRGLGTHDYIGQRVHQVTSIFRNLSFFDENLPVLAKNRTFIRFLVMCSNIRWGNLHQMGLDMLGNIAIELELWDPSVDDLTRCLLATISDGLQSPDRGVIISCLEILYKLCQKTTNEDYLHKCLDKKIYRQICLYLSLNDIMLLLYTLECMFALTSLGEKTCFAIVQMNGVIDTLVSLVSVEVRLLQYEIPSLLFTSFFFQAQSYGPDGCILMRVVETVPTHLVGQSTYSPHHGQHHGQQHQQNQQPQNQPLQAQAQPQLQQLQQMNLIHQQTLPQQPVQPQQTMQIIQIQQPTSHPQQTTQTLSQAQQPPPQQSQQPTQTISQQPHQQPTQTLSQQPQLQVQQQQPQLQHQQQQQKQQQVSFFSERFRFIEIFHTFLDVPQRKYALSPFFVTQHQ